MIKPNKKVKKWKYTRKEWIKKHFGVNNVSEIENGWDKVLCEDLLSTQPQPIKKEECPACNNPLSKYIHTCKNHNKLNKELKQSTPSPQEESKDIELPEKLITVDYCGELVQFTFEDEFINWVKQVTDTLNSLTKRNIK